MTVNHFVTIIFWRQ